MIDGYKVVVCTPAGREKYLSILSKHIKPNKLVDEWHLWLNTNKDRDINYIYSLADDKTKIIQRSDLNFNIDWQWNLHKFFDYCIEEDTIYIRIDDDVCYMRPDALENLLRFRIKMRGLFAVYGNVLNSTLNSFIQQRMGSVHTASGIAEYTTFDRTTLFLPSFAKKLHEDIVASIKGGDTNKYLFGEWRLFGGEHHSIMVAAWFGADLRRSTGMRADDELSFSKMIPDELGTHNTICGSALFVHHSYLYQRRELCVSEEEVDSTYLLHEYSNLI